MQEHFRNVFLLPLRVRAFYLCVALLTLGCSDGGGSQTVSSSEQAGVPGTESSSSTSSEDAEPGKPDSSVSSSKSVASSAESTSSASSQVTSSSQVSDSSTAISSSTSSAVSGTAKQGKGVYEQSCANCHNEGVGGAPKLGDADVWAARLSTNGLDGLYQNVVNGYGAMPAKGLCASCSEAELVNAVNYVLAVSLSVDATSLRSITSDGVVLGYDLPTDPQYPRRALARGIEGYVVLMHSINADGVPSDVRVVTSSSNLFDRAAIRALENSVFDVSDFGALVDVTTVYTFQISNAGQSSSSDSSQSSSISHTSSAPSSTSSEGAGSESSTASSQPPIDESSTIKVGILHSLSGTMATVETDLKDVLLMLIEKQNQQGGVLGRKLEPIVVDAASDWPLFAAKASELLSSFEVDVIFGGYTSVARKTILPAVEEHNSLLFYPGEAEGQESSKNIIYTGLAPNQNVLPVVDYLVSQEVEKWVLLGTDYVYPRTINKIISAHLHSKGVDASAVWTVYTPFGFSTWQSTVQDIQRFAGEEKVAVINTLSGDTNTAFFESYVDQLNDTEMPIVSLSFDYRQLARQYSGQLLHHLGVTSYLPENESDSNVEFISDWKNFVGEDVVRPVTESMAAHYVGFKAWIGAVEAAGSVDVDSVRSALYGSSVTDPSGNLVEILPNHYMRKTVGISRLNEDGVFTGVWASEQPVSGDAWSDVLPESQDRVADWFNPDIHCGEYDVTTGVCYGNTP